jgi:hypothetical protein
MQARDGGRPLHRWLSSRYAANERRRNTRPGRPCDRRCVERAAVSTGHPFRDIIEAVYVNALLLQSVARRLGVRGPAGVRDAAHAAIAARLR